ncbi:hypothetical protein FACS1894105_09190 [Clostridia bacterium]|nr:hypothetical protein FACS1894105_09190 [Clostridia bacterium]
MTQFQDLVLVKYYIEMLKKYAEFKGRATRAEFWWAMLTSIIINFVLYIFSMIPYIGVLFTVITTVVALGTIIPITALWFRRLHDVGKSGKLYIVFLCLAVAEGIFAAILIAVTAVSIASIFLGGGDGGGFVFAAFLVIADSIAIIVVGIILIIFAAKEGIYGPNQYGNDPRMFQPAQFNPYQQNPYGQQNPNIQQNPYGQQNPNVPPNPYGQQNQFNQQNQGGQPNPNIQQNQINQQVQQNQFSQPNQPQQQVNLTCPKCGTVYQKAQTFCTKCGTKMN